MGKKLQKEPAVIDDPLTFRIKKSKTFHQNLNLFLKMLAARFSQLPTRQYLSYVHKYIAKCRQKFTFHDQKQVVKTLEKIKICKSCDQWARKKQKIVQCIYCQDFYHRGCVNGRIEDEWCCQGCDKYFHPKESSKNALKARLSVKFNCAKCDNRKSTNKTLEKETLVYCIKCDERFHVQCFGKKNRIVCYRCHEEIEETIKQKEMIQSTLLQHGFQKSPSVKKYPKKDSGYSDLKKEQSSQLTTATSFPSVHEKMFRAQFPKMSTEQIASYKKELLYAIYSKKMEYIESLVAINCELEDDNENSLDFQIMSLCPEDTKLFLNYKQQPIGPFHLVYKEKMGYDVVAAKNLPKGMVICQYVGEVVTLRQAIKSKNDSIMEYKVGPNADQTLVIRPQKMTNIGRFINGINNKVGKDKANVKSFRVMALGRPAVILSTLHSIKQGESLLYDYNAGEKNTYPTDNFV